MKLPKDSFTSKARTTTIINSSMAYRVMLLRNLNIILQKEWYDTYRMPLTNINSKGFKTWNHKTVRRKQIKIFLTMVLAIISKANTNKKGKANKWDYIKLKSSMQQREKLPTKWKSNLWNGENVWKPCIYKG